jgi:hypothetical protein
LPAASKLVDQIQHRSRQMISKFIVRQASEENRAKAIVYKTATCSIFAAMCFSQRCAACVVAAGRG